MYERTCQSSTNNIFEIVTEGVYIFTENPKLATMFKKFIHRYPRL
jgi:histone deacetylase complex regulatory component SIN3